MSSKQGMSPEAKRNLLVIAGVFSVAVVAGAWFILSASSSNAAAAITKSSIPEISSDPIEKPAGSGQTAVNSEELDRLNKQKDEEDAKNAAKTGGTYIPSVVSGERQTVDPNAPKDGEKQSEVQAASSVAPIAPLTPLPTIQQPPPAPPVSPMKLAMLSTLETSSSSPPESVSGKTTRPEKPATQIESTTTNSATPATKACPLDAICNSSGKMLIATAGSTAFVEIDTSIMTDEPSPVFGKIISAGNPIMRNRTVIGTYVQNPNLTVGVTFNKLSLKDGSVPVNAVVINSDTGRTALSGKVDHKFFTRFGLPMLAAGAGEFAKLTAQAGATVSTGVGTMVQTSTLNSTQIGNAAIATGVKGAETALLASTASAKASTELPSNIGVAIRFLDDVWVPIP